jgi:hypothetical protein
MSLTSAQIVTLACQTARVPGYTAQAGQLLNSILSDLCQTYDFDVAKKTFNFNFLTSQVVNPAYPNIQAGGGPYPLPDDFLRCKKDDVMWFLQKVPYPMIPVDLSEYDWYVQQAGNQAYPYIFATDMSQSPPVAVVWPGASGAYPCMVRYCAQMPDIDTPETSATAPWFPNTRYLVKQLSSILMDLNDDDRAAGFYAQAEEVLRSYLQMKDDNANRSKRVTLDRRRFSRNFSSLPNTKTVGF